MKVKTVKMKKNIQVPLTEEEFKGHAVELAKLMGERGRLESQMASSRSHFKSKIDEVVAKIGAECQLIQEGKEWRDCACIQTLDYDEKTVTVAVEGTGEIVEHRPMYLSEMQAEMTFEEEQAAAEPEALPEDESAAEETEAVVEDEDEFDLGGEELERGGHAD